jgi:hypothetical protein
MAESQDNTNKKQPVIDSFTQTAPIIEDENGDLAVELSDEVLKAAGLTVGDSVEWVDQGDGTYILRKVEND